MFSFDKSNKKFIILISRTCPSELHFNGKNCDWPESAGCVVCETETTETPIEETTTFVPNSTEAAPTTCELSDCPELDENLFSFLPVPWDCSKYVICLNQQVYDM